MIARGTKQIEEGVSKGYSSDHTAGALSFSAAAGFFLGEL